MVNVLKVKREYFRQYGIDNRERLNEYHRKWAAEHPEKIRQYNERYWQRKANLEHQGVLPCQS